jgi:outer membrane protein W
MNHIFFVILILVRIIAKNFYFKNTQKIMKKAIMAFAAIVALSFSQANAQIQIGASGGINKILGDAGEFYKMGFGGGLDARYFINPKLAVGLNFSYLMHGWDVEGADASFNLMPISLTGSYFFSEEGFKPYAGLGLGMYMNSVSGGGESESGDSKIGFAPMAGFQYMFNDNLGLDVNLKYHYIMTEEEATTAFGANVGLVYNIGGKK